MPQNEDVLDNSKYDSLCGKDYKPYFLAKNNSQVLWVMSVITILTGIITFLLVRKSSYKFLYSGGVLFLLIGLTVFLSIALNGTPTCDGNNFVCKSKILKRNIPSEFCNYKIFCECPGGIDAECPQSCVCSSGLCVPKQGVRKSKITSKYSIKIMYMVLGIFLTFAIPVIAFLLQKNFIPNVSLQIKSLGLSFVILLSCIVFVTTLSYSTGYTQDFELKSCTDTTN